MLVRLRAKAHERQRTQYASLYDARRILRKCLRAMRDVTTMAASLRRCGLTRRQRRYRFRSDPPTR